MVSSPVTLSCSSPSWELLLWHSLSSAKSSRTSISKACSESASPGVWNSPEERTGGGDETNEMTDVKTKSEETKNSDAVHGNNKQD